MVCLSGEWDETEFNVFILMQPYYNIIMILKFSVLTMSEGHKEERRMVIGEIIKFNYTEVVYDN